MLGFAAVTLDPVNRQASDLGAEERLEDFVELVRADDRDDELQEAPPWPGLIAVTRPPRQRLFVEARKRDDDDVVSIVEER